MPIYSYAHVYIILICPRVHYTHMFTCSPVHMSVCTYVHILICSHVHTDHVHTRTSLVSTCSLAHICHTQLLMYLRITITHLRIMCHICTPVTLPTISPTHACARESVRMLTLCIGVPARTHRNHMHSHPLHPLTNLQTKRGRGVGAALSDSPSLSR